MAKWLDFGLNIENNPPNITVDDILEPLFQGGYPNTSRPGEPTTPNAHAPDPAVSFLKLFLILLMVLSLSGVLFRLFAYHTKGKSFYYYMAITVLRNNTRYN